MSEKNVELWTKNNAEFTDGAARQSWVKEEFSWGIWGLPESDLRVLDDVAGLDVVELGCGTAYCSTWLTRMGAKVVGVDPTPAQLETARRLQSAETHSYYDYVTAEWGRKWPAEEIWAARKSTRSTS